NGMGHFEKIAQYFPENHIIGGTAMIATVLNGPGTVDFMGPKGSEAMHMSKYAGHIDTTTKQVMADFKAADLNPIWS
ncbi:ketopantoate reductase family protein, partial [Mycobacterium kansasii]